MNKKKQAAFYFLLGALALVLVNYPMLRYAEGWKLGEIPGILVVFVAIAVAMAGVGMWLAKRE